MATTSYRELLPPVFTEEEIQQELDRLGITNIDKASLRQFRHELQDLIQEVSASSPGFPETCSSSTSDAVVVGSSYNQTGSDMFTEDEVEAESMAKSPPSSSLSVPSPLLTPPLGDSNSCDVSMGRKKPGDGDLINCRRVWGDNKYPDIEPPLRKYPQFGRERQINLNAKLNHRGGGSISPETQLLENVSFDKRSTTQQEKDDVPFSSSSDFTTNNPKKSYFNSGSNNPDVNKPDNPVASYSRPTRTRSPQPSGERNDNDNAIDKSEISTSTNEKKKKDQFTVVQSNDSGSLLDELLRSYNSENKSLKNNFVKIAPKKMTKRKIARKDNQGKTYVDESYTDSETGSLLDPAEYFERLREMNKTVYDNIAAAAASSEESSDNDFYPRRSESAFFSNTDERPKSVILIPVTPPKLKKNKKSDPVNRYQQFRDYWAHHKVPGENKHSEIRWIIKEKMLQQDDIIESRPRKVYVANNYVVPTEKHRSSLRWQIRTDLAYGLMPSLKDNYSHF